MNVPARAAVALALLVPAFSACELDQSVVHVLLADASDARWSEVAVPGFEERVKETCDGCVVQVESAGGDPARQADQFAAALDEGADAVVLDAVDPEGAKSWIGTAEDVPVVAWDRLVSGADYFVGAQPGAVGDVLAKAVADSGDGRVLVLEAPRGDVDAETVLADARRVLRNESDVVAATTAGEAEQVVAERTGAAAYDAVLASTDQQAAGAAAALDGREGAPVVVGPDAWLETARRVVEGTQGAASYVPWHHMATQVADVVVPVLTGGRVRGGEQVDGVRSWVVQPDLVTIDSLTGSMVRDGAVDLDELCARGLRQRCTSLGLV